MNVLYNETDSFQALLDGATTAFSAYQPLSSHSNFILKTNLSLIFIYLYVYSVLNNFMMYLDKKDFKKSYFITTGNLSITETK